jgi:glutathione S-transferase
MKLYGSHRSPFTRKTRVAVHELDLAQAITFVPVVVSSTTTDDALAALNPLGQIPTLVLDDGEVIHDSLIICEYLDVLAGGALLPREGPERWRALTRHDLANGLLETLVKLFTERKRADDPRHPIYADAFTAKARRVLPALDRIYADGPQRSFDLGDIACACALAYADFRFAELEWRKGLPNLERRYAAMAERPSMRATDFSGEGTAG